MVSWAGGGCTVGPVSVGAQLQNQALSRGGNSCTATDIAVALGRMEFGDPALACAGINQVAPLYFDACGVVDALGILFLRT